MRTTITEEPDDALAVKIIPLAHVLEKDAWRDPQAFAKRWLRRFKQQIERAMPEAAFKIEAYGMDGVEPSIMLLARPREAEPLE